MVTMGAPAATTSPWRAARTFTLPLTGAKTCAVAHLDLGLLGQSAGVLHLVAGRVDGARGDVGEQFMGAGLAQRGFGGGDVLAGRIDGGLGGLQAGGRVVLGLLAHDALLGQRDGAAGVGLLVLVVGLRLGQRGLRGAAPGPRR